LARYRWLGAANSREADFSEGHDVAIGVNDLEALSHWVEHVANGFDPQSF
jgi:hypothetical protein